MITWPTLVGRTAIDLQQLVADRFAAANLFEGAN